MPPDAEWDAALAERRATLTPHDRRLHVVLAALLVTAVLGRAVLPLLPQPSAVYEWANRLFVLLGLAGLFGYLIDVVGTFRRPEEFKDAPNDRWWWLAIAILGFPLFFVYYGGQVLDALWLR